MYVALYNQQFRTRACLTSQSITHSTHATPQQLADPKGARADVLKEFSLAEQRLKPSITEMFTDVYDTKPRHLLEQVLSNERSSSSSNL